MNQLKIDDRLIDKINGPSTIIDADHYDGIIFESDDGLVFRRSLTQVQLMAPVPPESKIKTFFRAVFIGVLMVALFTLVVVVVVNSVIIYPN